MRVAILTVSDLGALGQREDTSGEAILDWAAGRGYEVVVRSVVADETDRIAAKLARWADSGEVAVILTTGGTGLTRRAVTPEATAAVLERAAPGIAEALRAASGRSFPRAWLSRGTAGTRGATVIVNLPGSTGGVQDGLRVLEGDLEHAVRLNGQLEAAGFETELATSFDEVRQAVGGGRREPECLILTGGLHETSDAHLLALARDRSISTLGLVEPTEPDA